MCVIFQTCLLARSPPSLRFWPNPTVSVAHSLLCGNEDKHFCSTELYKIKSDRPGSGLDHTWLRVIDKCYKQGWHLENHLDWGLALPEGKHPFPSLRIPTFVSPTETQASPGGSDTGHPKHRFPIGFPISNFVKETLKMYPSEMSPSMHTALEQPFSSFDWFTLEIPEIGGRVSE